MKPIKKRLPLLDALRGFALLGICLANYEELSLFSFLDVNHTANVESGLMDKIQHFLIYFFVEGKFYTIFSVLFGIGFSIIIGNAVNRGANGMRIFYRRMMLLLCIGFMHLMLLWSGDILMLYAAMGMILPLFYNCKIKTLLWWALLFLFLPIPSAYIVSTFDLQPCSWFYAQMDYWQSRFGIGDWGTWLKDSQSYVDVLKFLVMGAFERMTEFISSDRYFKVLGLFLIGLIIGKSKIYAEVETHRLLLKRVIIIGFIVGIPIAILYALDGVNGYGYPKYVHNILEALSIYPMGLAYMAAFALYAKRIVKPLTYPGRMALSCYIGQSLIGICLFYGFGLGLGMTMSLPQVMLTAVGVYVFEIIFAYVWMKYFTYGPLEWIWRMLTYGQWLKPLKEYKE